jgi:hypothetical protein
MPIPSPTSTAVNPGFFSTELYVMFYVLISFENIDFPLYSLGLSFCGIVSAFLSDGSPASTPLMEGGAGMMFTLLFYGI